MREIVGFAFYSDWTFNIPILWRPVNGQPQTWRVSQLATLASPGSGYLMNADWINNIGQIVGEGDDANFNWVATFWNSRASGTIKLIVPNNAVSLVRRVNDLGFAAGTYSSETCSWCAFVEQLPRKP